MNRKIFKTGNSLVISIPKESLEQLDLAEGSAINVSVNMDERCIVIKPALAPVAEINPEFAQQLDDFIERYRPALEALAK